MGTIDPDYELARELEHERDLHMLRELCQAAESQQGDAWDEGLREEEAEAFTDMLKRVEQRPLTHKQRAWVESACDRLSINKTPLSQRKPVPRGREVPLADVLRKLPLKPPGRR